ncbi:MAG: hypothetical protein AB7S81_06165 [Bdellovibrionales bacterium]
MSTKTKKTISNNALFQKLLLHLLKEEKGYCFGSFPFSVEGQSFEFERVHRALNDLQDKGYVKPVKVPSRGWSSDGHALTVKGERFCDKMKGRNFKAVEKELRQGIVRRLGSQLDITKAMHPDCFPKPEGVGTARMDAAIDIMIAKEILKKQMVHSGWFPIDGYALTPKAVQRVNRVKSSHAVLVL